ncbi:MAG: helix-turn-helix domain-containing protein [Clostridiales bacterium]|nr:helix-turn-helix domain-containing protein [Clostridiales bacterium]
MILADKIIQLRKKNGWSQEELANQMNVSRQSVSKWESAQSVPDLDKILQLSQIFGVSTDYLLKDEIELEEYNGSVPVSGEDIPSAEVRRVPMEEANAFLAVKQRTAKPVALAVGMCILSPVSLFLLGTAAETGRLNIGVERAESIALIILLFMVAAAVAVFISCGMKTKPYEYLEREPIETEYGVSGMVKERKERYKDSYSRHVVIGTCLCVVAAVPLFIGCFWPEDAFYCAVGLSVTLILVATGVYFYIVSGTYWSSLQKLLQEGDYTRERKRNSKYTEAIATVYWLIATAIFLAYSFVTEDWGRSWIVWPVAGVLFAAVMTVCNIVQKSKEN